MKRDDRQTAEPEPHGYVIGDEVVVKGAGVGRVNGLVGPRVITVDVVKNRRHTTQYVVASALRPRHSTLRQRLGGRDETNETTKEDVVNEERTKDDRQRAGR